MWEKGVSPDEVRAVPLFYVCHSSFGILSARHFLVVYTFISHSFTSIRHDSLHTRRRDMVVTIDLAGRRVVEQVAEGGVEDARAKYQARTSEAGAEQRALRVAGIEKLKDQLAADQQ